jgi:AraC-like DNA-binding protein
MRRFVFSTDDLPQTERFSLWRETISEGLFGTSPERPEGEANAPFSGRLEALIGGPVAYAHYRISPYRVRRRAQDIARVGWSDSVLLYRNWSNGVRMNYGGMEFAPQPGDLFVADPTIPLEAFARTEFDEEVMFVPRAMLEPHLATAGLRRVLNFNGDGGVAGLAKSYFDGFVKRMDTLDERELVSVTDTFCRLLALACGAAAGEHGEAIRSARLDEVKRYIDINITDPKLTPQKVASGLKMSERQLHLLFEPSGTSFARHLMRRRLEECRAALLANPARPVTDIALAWGFNSLPTFYRSFQAAFGMSPGEFRGAERVTGSPLAGFAKRLAAE